MNERRHILNRKCFAALRAISTTPDPKWKYILVNGTNVFATDTVSLIQISTPCDHADQPAEPRVYAYDDIKNLIPKHNETVEMPEGEPMTTGRFNVPNFMNAIPGSNQAKAKIVINAQNLVDLLRAAMGVTEHRQNLVGLSIHDGCIRIDTHHDSGGQTFVGVLARVDYNGVSIPGHGAHNSGKYVEANEKTNVKTLKLPIYGGRKFRD